MKLPLFHHVARMLLVLAVAAMPFTSAADAVRESIRSDTGWLFHLGDAPGSEQPEAPTTGWRAVQLPHDWSIEGRTDAGESSAGGGGFFPTGTGWYRHTLRAPAEWRGKLVSVRFEGVYRNAEVWINGTRLGSHAYGYTPFSFDVSPHLRYGADNIIAVRVDNSAQPNSRWYSGSGIYRHVFVDVSPRLHIAPSGVFAVTTAASTDAATLSLKTTVRNGTDAPQRVSLDLALLDGAKTAASASSGIDQEIAPGGEWTATTLVTVQKPKLWSPESPALYSLRASLRSGGQVIDEVNVPTGLRTVKVSASGGFELNGRRVVLFGGNVHHDNGPLGAAAFDRAEVRKVELLKAAGFNAVRTSHNPPSPAFLDACDRLGLLVMDEAFDGWAKAKVDKDYSRDFAANWQGDIDAMVLRDRHHASIVMWSIGNEVYERGNASGIKIANDLANRIRALDTSRPVTVGLNGLGKGGDWTKLDPVFAAVDVAGYNYEIPRYGDDHARVPERVIVCTESYLADTFASATASMDHTYVIGDFVWSAIDYLGEAGIGRVYPPDQKAQPHWIGVHYPWHGAACGDIDLTGWRRPASHYRTIAWDRGESLYAAVIVPSPDDRPWNVTQWTTAPAMPSWTWPGLEGRKLDVEVYSRHAAVRLYLNDKLIGEKPTTRAEQWKAVFSVPYSAGTLRAVGMRDGREVERVALTTARNATKLRLTVDRTKVKSGGQDLAYVTVEAVDAAGVIHPGVDQSVQYSVSGAGVIAGIASGDLTTTEPYHANPRRLYQGRALVVIRTTEKTGPITLTSTSPSMGSASVRISAE